MTNLPTPVCIGCNKHPWELNEYSREMTGEDLSPEEFVWQEEGTLNPLNGHFLCTPCYIKAGQPSGSHGWVAP